MCIKLTCVFALELRPRRHGVGVKAQFLTLKSGFQGREYWELGKM